MKKMKKKSKVMEEKNEGACDNVWRKKRKWRKREIKMGLTGVRVLGCREKKMEKKWGENEEPLGRCVGIRREKKKKRWGVDYLGNGGRSEEKKGKKIIK